MLSSYITMVNNIEELIPSLMYLSLSDKVNILKFEEDVMFQQFAYVSYNNPWNRCLSTPVGVNRLLYSAGWDITLVSWYLQTKVVLKVKKSGEIYAKFVCESIIDRDTYFVANESFFNDDLFSLD